MAVARVATVDPLLGTVVDGRYRVEAVLGEGGMGVVFRCRHQIIDKLVAMKVLRADLASDEEATTRFLNEARAASAIGSAHIVDVSDFGRLPDGSTYFVMEYLDGRPLSSITRQGQPVPVKRIIEIALQLAEGLAAAHRSGIVHRDLKPDNIVLVSRGSERNFVKILDFGIAKVSTAGQTSRLTRAGAVFGTPHYMSPEQAAGASVDHRVDVYALGVILYELASGRVPFDADHFMGILTQHMYKAPVPIRALVPAPPEVPPGLDAIVLKCLSKQPELRYGSMEELFDDLVRLREGMVPAALAELVQRSQGFDILLDPLAPGMPAPVPATPACLRSKWPLYASIAGVGATVGLVALVFALSAPINAAPTPPTDLPGVGAPNPVPVAPPAAAPTEVERAISTQSAEQDPVGVVLRVGPADAHVYEGAHDLGAGSVVVPVQATLPRRVEVRRKDYQSQQTVLDGTQQTVNVELEPKGRRPAPEPSSQPRAVTEPETEQQSQPITAQPADKPDVTIVEPWPTDR